MMTKRSKHIFDDMIISASGEIEPCDILIIDEAQDFSIAQWDYIHRLIRNMRPTVDESRDEWEDVNG